MCIDDIILYFYLNIHVLFFFSNNLQIIQYFLSHNHVHLAEYTSSSLGLKLAPEARRFTAAAVNGAAPPPLPREWSFAVNERKTRRGETLLCWSSRSLRKLQDDAPLPCPSSPFTPFSLSAGHMYSRGWTKVIGDIMEANGRVGGFQFHMCELRSTTGTLSSGLDERTDGRTDLTTSDTPMKIPVRVRLRNDKTTAAPATTSARSSK